MHFSLLTDKHWHISAVCCHQQWWYPLDGGMKTWFDKYAICLSQGQWNTQVCILFDKSVYFIILLLVLECTPCYIYPAELSTDFVNFLCLFCQCSSLLWLVGGTPFTFFLLDGFLLHAEVQSKMWTYVLYTVQHLSGLLRNKYPVNVVYIL